MNQRSDDVLTDLLTELGGRADGPAAMPPELGDRITRRRRRHSAVGAATAVVAVVAVGAAVATYGFGSNGEGSRTTVMPGASGTAVEQSVTPTPTPPLPAVIGGDHAADCPVGALPLGDVDARVSAVEKTMRELGRYYPGVNLDGVTARPKIATDDSNGIGGMAVHSCGEEVAARTLVVTLDFPAMGPSASLSSGVVFVSKTDAGWNVWRVVR